MAPNLPLLVLLLLVLPAAAPRAGNAAAAAFNVTEILARYPEFKLFNLLLSKTRVAREINSRNSVTVLVPDNSAVDWLLRRSNRLARASLVELMSVHVVLDYIDAAKLAALAPRDQPAVVTTLFQTTGTARNRTGFLNVTAARGGGAVFVSAAPGSLVSATLKRAVTAKPYNISVLQISNFVVPPGVVTRPRPPSPPMLLRPRMRQMSIAPSPAPAALPTTSEGDAGEAPDAAEAPAPSSHGHVAQATSRRWIGAAVGMALACTIGYL
ncbi:fasciclin-like arabinogalactan protein 14 [Panicum miliaceum]|uniref:Fasciclin-like arabinogalactan protein 14 n=1 Tax=Panicum miliaceum TaxID=4540 RepID=A0A3L6S4J7_PANMI|nr:fasciclin-like arabinogalactan protein 14 [Panicum miliaceum]